MIYIGIAILVIWAIFIIVDYIKGRKEEAKRGGRTFGKRKH